MAGVPGAGIKEEFSVVPELEFENCTEIGPLHWKLHFHEWDQTIGIFTLKIPIFVQIAYP